MRTPDTSIVCSICQGSKRHPQLGHQCGACFGSGLSTHPWDQRKRATTVTRTSAELDALRQAGVEVVVHRASGDLDWATRAPTFIALIAWENPNYRGT